MLVVSCTGLGLSLTDPFELQNNDFAYFFFGLMCCLLIYGAPLFGFVIQAKTGQAKTVSILIALTLTLMFTWGHLSIPARPNWSPYRLIVGYLTLALMGVTAIFIVFSKIKHIAIRKPKSS